MRKYSRDYITLILQIDSQLKTQDEEQKNVCYHVRKLFTQLNYQLMDISAEWLPYNNEDWKYIHIMPQYLEPVAKDLNPQ